MMSHIKNISICNQNNFLSFYTPQVNRNSGNLQGKEGPGGKSTSHFRRKEYCLEGMTHQIEYATE